MIAFTQNLGAYIYVMAFGFTLSLAFSGFMISVGVGDEPNHRSSHNAITPTCGGVGVLAGFSGVFLLSAMAFPQLISVAGLAPLLFAAIGVAIIGLYDDILIGRALPKLFLLLSLSLLTAYIIGPIRSLPLGGANILDLPYSVGLVGTALWVFVVMNAVNFIDGSNGLMTGVLITAGCVIGFVAFALGATLTGLWIGALIAGCGGIVPYNFRNKALIFSGDIGALLGGHAFAVAALLLTRETPLQGWLYVGPLLLLPVLTDVFMTLMKRALRRQNLFMAHRDHLYQRLIQAGMSHMRVARLYIMATLIMAIWTFMLISMNLINSLPIFGLSVVLAVCVYLAIDRRLAKPS